MALTLLWTAVPLLLLHVWMWRRSRRLLAFQGLLDVVLAAVVGPALVLGADLNPVRCLERNRPFTEVSWSPVTEFQPTQSDLVLQFHPWWEATREQLLDGRLPLIAEEMGGGLPLLANGQTGLWAPVMLPVWALGPERGTTVMALWKLELAGLGTFLMLWRVWRLRWAAAALGGVAYAGGAYQVAWLLVPLSWLTAALPWLWWMVVAILRRRARWPLTVAFGVSGGWLLGCGLHPETAAIAFGSALLAGLILHPRRWPRLAVAAVLATASAAALAWPTVGYIGASSRLHTVRESAAAPPTVPSEWRGPALRQTLLPAVNGHPGRGDWRAPFPHAPAATGVGGCALALIAAGGLRRRHRRLVLAAAACLCVGAILYLRLPPLDGLLVRVPPLDRMTLPRFAALLPWALAVLAAVSVDGALRGRRRRVPWRVLPGLVLAAVAVMSRPWELVPVDVALVLLAVMLAATVPFVLHRPRLVAAAAAVELALTSIGINPVAAAADRLPEPPLVQRLAAAQAAEGGRVVGLGGVLPPNLAARYGLADLRAYDPLRPRPFAEMLMALGQTDPVLGGPLRQVPPRLAGAWSVRFLVAPPAAEPDGWELLWRGDGGSLWRNPHWLPELRVVRRSVVGGWDLVTSERVDFASTAVVPVGTPAAAADEAHLTVGARTGSSLAVDVACDGPCVMAVAQPWSPGWSVAVDGVSAPVVRVNLAGLGAALEPGEHRVVFRYRPWRWRGGVP